MTTLQDICLQITDGKHGDCQNEEGSGYYFVSCKDVKDGWVDYSSARQITEEDYLDAHRRTRLEPDDILITNSGTIGRITLVPSATETGRTTFQKSVAILKPRKESVIPRWLYYYLVARRVELIAWAGGTAQKNLLLRDLRAFKVFEPPLSTQRKIAAVLSAYDNLIENNLRRIKILEAIAQLIYREWFVNFRFPRHEKVRMVESPVGKVPKGWGVMTLGEVADVRWGDTSTTKQEYTADGYDAYSASGLDGKLSHFDYERDGIVLSAIGANCGVTWFARGKWSCIKNTIRFWSIRPEVSNEYLFLLTRQPDFWKRRGSAQPFISQGDAQESVIIISDPDIMKVFTMLVKPCLAKADLHRRVNLNLRRTRDLLLPKLISGELDVSELDIDMEGTRQ